MQWVHRESELDITLKPSSCSHPGATHSHQKEDLSSLYLLDVPGQPHSWTHCSYADLHKTCPRSRQSTFQQGWAKGQQGSTTGWEALGCRWQLGEGESIFLRPPGRLTMFQWVSPHSSTNWMQWIIREKKKKEEKGYENETGCGDGALGWIRLRP